MADISGSGSGLNGAQVEAMIRAMMPVKFVADGE